MASPPSTTHKPLDFVCDLKIAAMLMKIATMLSLATENRTSAEELERHIKESLDKEFTAEELAVLIKMLKVLGDSSQINMDYTTMLLVRKILQKT